MFTGIVEEMGRIGDLETREGALTLKIQCKKALEGTAIGDSVAVSGVCLTVIAIEGDAFSTTAVPETLRKTTLGSLTVGDRVNLERAASAETFLGGHYVQGHVDGTARITRIEPDGEATNYTFEIDSQLARYLVPKGFVAVDGASLTVVEATENSFSLTLVPHTQEAVVMGSGKVGDQVNVEVDVMAKYVERIVGSRLEALEDRIRKLEKP
jgi:riboflavin synthase